MARYTVFIDESGNECYQANQKDDSRNTPYFTLGAVLVENKNYDEVNSGLLKIESKLGKKIHFNKLSHNQKVYVCNEIVKLPIVLFGVISNKRTIGDWNPKSPSRFYNKNCKYLLERIGLYNQRQKIDCDDVKYLFEEKRGVDYKKLSNYIEKIKGSDSSSHLSKKQLSFVNQNFITSKRKDEENLFSISDAMAHSLFKICDRSEKNLHVTETRYLSILSKKIYSSFDILKEGLKLVHNVNDIQITEENRLFIEKLSS